MLLTRLPLSIHCIATTNAPLDLHVLCTLPALTLSQDQTLQLKDWAVSLRKVRRYSRLSPNGRIEPITLHQFSFHAASGATLPPPRHGTPNSFNPRLVFIAVNTRAQGAHSLAKTNFQRAKLFCLPPTLLARAREVKSDLLTRSSASVRGTIITRTLLRCQ